MVQSVIVMMNWVNNVHGQCPKIAQEEDIPHLLVKDLHSKVDTIVQRAEIVNILWVALIIDALRGRHTTSGCQ